MKARVRVSYTLSTAPGTDGVEFGPDGKTPVAFRLWRFGENQTDKDPEPGRPTLFTLRSAKLVRAAYQDRGLPLRIDYEHESTIAIKDRRGPDVGIGAGKGRLAYRGGKDAPEPWIEGIEWTARAIAQIHAKERTEISPLVLLDADTREVVKIINVALCFEGATHNGVQLAAAREKGNMEEIIAKIVAALEAGDFETAEQLINEVAGMDGGEAYAQSMGAMMKAVRAKMTAGADDPPPEKKEPEAARLAARRAPVVDYSDAFSRALAPARAQLDAATRNAEAATKRSDKATVHTMLAFARNELPAGAIDSADEREHLAAADPVATEKFIASLRRKVEKGIVVANGRTGEKSKDPPREKPKAKDPMEELTAGDKIAMEAFNRGKPADKQITAEDFIASKRGQQTTRGAN